MRVGLCLVSTDSWMAWSAYDFGGLIGRTVAARPDVDLRRFLATGCEIPQLREKTTTAALRAGCDWVLYLDTDMRYPPDTLVRLLAHDKPVVGANYTARRPPFEPVSAKRDGEKVVRVYTEQESTGLEMVGSTGMGCLLVSAQVLDAMKPPRFMIPWVADDQDHAPEDLFFSRKLNELKVPIYVDHDLSHEVRHLGIVEIEVNHAVEARNVALKPRLVT